MQIFYVTNIDGNTAFMNEAESRHCTKVLRKKNGDEVVFIDGEGAFYKAEIADDSGENCKLNILDIKPDFEKRNYYLHLAIAPTKNIDRFEWFLEKAVEIGVDEITPLICHHSERRKLRPERLHKVMISAMKQSVKATLPVLNDLTPFHKFVHLPFEGNKCLAHCNKDNPKEELLLLSSESNRYLILIGPEGARRRLLL